MIGFAQTRGRGIGSPAGSFISKGRERRHGGQTDPRRLPHGDPYLTVNDAASAIAFYKEAFGAKELFRMEGPDGRVGHAEILVGNSPIMLSDECPVMKSAQSPVARRYAHGL